MRCTHLIFDGRLESLRTSRIDLLHNFPHLSAGHEDVRSMHVLGASNVDYDGALGYQQSSGFCRTLHSQHEIDYSNSFISPTRINLVGWTKMVKNTIYEYLRIENQLQLGK